MKPFRALRVHQEGSKLVPRFETVQLADLDAGELVIRVHYSSVNYKDALGVTGNGKIFRKFPIIPGIDAAGVIESSSDPRFKPKQEVVITGCGLGESHDGGYAEYLRVPADWAVPLPAHLSLKEAMMIGTAGFTAALCIERMEQNAQDPAKGAILVTGASGGVGSLAVDMLARKGYQVIAVSGKKSQHDFLKKLGAAEIIAPEKLIAEAPKPLDTSRWAGAIDNVGGSLLASIIPQIHLWGNIACVGLAGGHQLTTTVMPMILRGVSLLGISSTNCPYPLRSKIWQRLAGDLKPRHLPEICQQEVPLLDLDDIFKRFFTRQVTGRILVKVQ